jgi:sugar lactone lactonase YvrE
MLPESEQTHPGIPMLRLPACSALLAITLALSACGGGSGSSPAPTPTPIQAAAIVTQPAPATVSAGQAVTFTVAATGSGLSYQWQRDGKDIAGATAASYVLNNVQPGDDGASFTVVVRNGAGSVTSAPAVLKVGGAKGLSLLAGGLGGPGNLDGTDARFARPGIIALSPSGLLYVADNVGSYDNTGVRRTVDIATGAVATVQGEALPGTLVGMAFDGAGNRYELGETAIYKTTPAGARSLLAGNGAAGYVDANGANARFGRAVGLAIDGAGNLYVADDGNLTVRKVTPAGEVSTLAGTPGTQGLVDGSGSAAHFRGLYGVTVDRAGNVYVLDLGILRKITPAGAVTTYSLKPEGQSGSVAFYTRSGIAVDAVGNLYVADSTTGCRIRQIAADGTVTDFAGKAGSVGSADGKGDTARFCANFNSDLGNLAIDSAGNLYVGDPSNQTIRRITPAAEVSTVAGRAAQIANIDGDGAAARFGLASVLVPPPRAFYEPAYELTVDAQGNVYVGESDRIRKVSPAGAVSTLAPAAGAAAGTAYYGAGLAVDGSRLAVSDGILSRIDANGAMHFLAGRAGVPARAGLADGKGAEANFFSPNKLIMDGLGNVYLEDAIYHNPATEPLSSQVVQRRIAPDGAVTTLPEGLYQGRAWYAGKDGTVWVAKYDGSVVRIAPDGKSTTVRAAPAAGVNRLSTALTADRAGNVYLAEVLGIATSNGSPPAIVSRITPAGAESVVAGSEAWSGVRLGAPGSLGPVDALAVSDDGSVYVMSENAVLRLAP